MYKTTDNYNNTLPCHTVLQFVSAVWDTLYILLNCQI